jgi:hypothetical protein
MVPMDSAGIRAMHSEILRRTSCAGRITATASEFSFDNDFASGFHLTQYGSYVAGQIALADVQRLHIGGDTVSAPHKFSQSIHATLPA